MLLIAGAVKAQSGEKILVTPVTAQEFKAYDIVQDKDFGVLIFKDGFYIQAFENIQTAINTLRNADKAKMLNHKIKYDSIFLLTNKAGEQPYTIDLNNNTTSVVK